MLICYSNNKISLLNSSSVIYGKFACSCHAVKTDRKSSNLFAKNIKRANASTTSPLTAITLSGRSTPNSCGAIRLSKIEYTSESYERKQNK